ncbi:hypothetical protein [Pseudenhygromyxa sp. WMMC2535]|nr:hypothetical protein [Pseudenhygromyxa sp. WMMC2535]
MAENKQEDHPQVPGLTAMAWFALILFVSLIGLVLFLQFKFGTPG